MRRERFCEAPLWGQRSHQPNGHQARFGSPSVTKRWDAKPAIAKHPCGTRVAGTHQVFKPYSSLILI